MISAVFPDTIYVSWERRTMQISRHWRLNSIRYRLEGVRYQNGGVSLQNRPVVIDVRVVVNGGKERQPRQVETIVQDDKKESEGVRQ